jgi:hypothetical protein
VISAAKPMNESERLAALESYEVLDSAPERAYDDIVLLASRICGTPIALMGLVDEERVWHKRRQPVRPRSHSRPRGRPARDVTDTACMQPGGRSAAGPSRAGSGRARDIEPATVSTTPPLLTTSASGARSAATRVPDSF